MSKFSNEPDIALTTPPHTRALNYSVTLVAVVWGGFQLYVAYEPFLDPIRLGAVHLAFALTLVFIRFPFLNRLPRLGAFVSALEIALIISTALYIFQEIQGLYARLGMFNLKDTVYGMIAMALVLDATRRVLGAGLTILVIIFLLYTYFGHHIPGLAGHVQLSNAYIVGHMFMSSDGIFGTPMMVAASYVMLFVLFGTFMEAAGGTDLLMRVAQRTLGWTRGGAAKMSVFLSSLFGTISGAAVANVVTVGSLTIPLMKRTGYSGPTAGGIEAAASTGGQIMPPVMGAAAFIMAAILGMNYSEVALGALLPAVLFYISLMIAVDLRAKATGIRGLPIKDLPKLKEVPYLRWLLLTPIGVLIYFLMIVGTSAPLAGLYALLSTVAVGFLVNGPRFVLKLIDGFRRGAVAMLQVSVAVAAAGIIIGSISSTGLDTKFSTLILQATAGNLFFTLVTTAMAAIVLGMGMPTVGVYLILSILVAPALVDLGVAPLAAHMFIFYFGIMSTITPPVAVSAYAAAGIASAKPIPTSLAAFRLAAAGYLIPFLFVYSPELLLQIDRAADIFGIIASFFAVITWAVAFAGVWWVRLSRTEVLILLLAGGLLVFPSHMIRGGALILLAGIFLAHRRKALGRNHGAERAH